MGVVVSKRSPSSTCFAVTVYAKMRKRFLEGVCIGCGKKKLCECKNSRHKRGG